jgi:transposase InsO family protein
LDKLSRPIELVNCKNADGETSVAELQCYLRRHGLPAAGRTDGGRHFNNDQFSSFLAGLGVEYTVSARCHPQAQGAVERVNRVILEVIREMVGNYSRRWRMSAQRIAEFLWHRATVNIDPPPNKAEQPAAGA